MKYPRHNLFLIFSASLVASSSTYAITKAGAGTELTDPASWTGGIAPGTADVATWDATSNGGPQTLTGTATWNQMTFTSLTGALNISGSQLSLSGATSNGSFNVVNVTAGTQAISIANDLVLTGANSTSAVVAGNNTTRLQLNANATNLTFGNVTSNGGGLANDANLWLRGSSTGNIINGTLTVDGQLAKGDAGIWTLNGANSVGWVFVNNGGLLAGNNAAFGTGTVFIGGGGGNVTLASVDATARNYTNALDFTANNGGGAGTGFGNVASFGQSSGGTGTQTFSSTVNLGTVARNIATNSNTTFSGVVSGVGGGINKSGSATLTLSSANTYSGGTTISAGTVQLGNASALGSGTLTITATGTNIVNTVPMSGAVTIANNIALNNTGDTGFQMLGGTGNSVNLAGNITGTTSRLFLNNNVTGNGTAIFNLSGNNTFTTSTSIYVNRGSLRIGSATALGASTNLLHYDSNAGTLSFAGSYTIANNINFTFAAQNLDTEANNVVLSGIIGGSQKLTKIGTGTLAFTNINTYTGGTTVSAGTLIAANNSALGTGNVTVATGAILQIGNGVNNGVTLGSTATFSTADTNSTLKIGHSTSSIIMSAAGLFNLADGTNLDITGLDLGAGTYTLIDGTAAGSTVGAWDQNTDLIGGDLANFSYVLALGGTNDAVLTITAVPEPSAALLGSLCLLAFSRRRRS